MAPIPISAKISLEGVEKAALLQQAVSSAFSKGVEEGLGALKRLSTGGGEFAPISTSLAVAIESGATRGLNSLSRSLVDFQRQLSSLKGPGLELVQSGFRSIAEDINKVLPGSQNLAVAFAEIKKITDSLVIGNFTGDLQKVAQARGDLEGVVKTFGDLGANVKSVVTSSLQESIQGYVSSLKDAATAEQALQEKIEARQRLLNQEKLINDRTRLDVRGRDAAAQIDAQIQAKQREQARLIDPATSGNFFRRVGLPVPQQETVDAAEDRKLLEELARRKSIQDKLEEAARRADKARKKLDSTLSSTSTGPGKSKIVGDLFDVRNATEKFGDAIALAAKRYSAFLLGGGVIIGVISSFTAATREALEFEKVITKIQQVANLTNASVSGISDAIRTAAKSSGTKGVDVGQGVLTLAQAGIQDPRELARTAEVLAKVPLAPSFDGIGQSVEGLLAVFGQFNKGIQDTADIFDVVNQFANDFAIESKDIFEIVKRGGAAFATTGGDIKEFIALSSLLRESTRESADSLGVFFKSGVAQLFTTKSRGLLSQLGVNKDQSVVGTLKELGTILTGPGTKFSGQQQIDISRQLVGTRQFARLLSLLRELNDPKQGARIEKSLASVGGSFDRGIKPRVDDIGQSFSRLRENFNDIAKGIVQNEGIKTLVKDLTNLATVGLQLTGVLTKLSPLLLAVGVGVAARSFGQVSGRVLSKFRGSSLSEAEILETLPGGVSSLSTEQKALIDGAVARRAQTRIDEQRRKARINNRLAIGAGSTFLLGGALSFVSQEGSTGATAGQALQAGGSLGAVGAVAGPLGAAVGFLIGAFSSLGESAKNLTDKLTEAAFSQAETEKDRIDAAVTGLTNTNKFTKSNGFSDLFSILGAGFNPKLFLQQQAGGGIVQAISQFLPRSAQGAIGNFASEPTERIKQLRAFRERGVSLSSEEQSTLFSADIQDNTPEAKRFKGILERQGQQLARDLRSKGVDDAAIRRIVTETAAATVKVANPNLDRATIQAGIAGFDFGTKNPAAEKLKDAGLEFSVLIKQVLLEMSDAIRDGSKKFAEFGVGLSRISTSPLSGRANVLTSNNETLLRQFGLDNLGNALGFRDTARNAVTKLFGQQGGRIRDLVQELGAGQEAGSGPIQNSRDFFELLSGETGQRASKGSSRELRSAQFTTEGLTFQFGAVLDRLFAQFNSTGDKDFKEFIKQLSDNPNAVIAANTPDAQAAEEAATAIRAMNDEINKSVEVSKALSDASIVANRNIVDVTDKIRNLRFNAEDAAVVGQRFLRNTTGGTVQDLEADANTFANRANELSKLASNPSRIPYRLSSGNIDRVFTNVQNAIDFQRTDDGLSPQKSLFFQSILNDFSQVVENLNKEFVDAGEAVEFMSRAAEAARGAFKAFDGELASNTGVKSFSIKDLSESFKVLDSIGGKLDLSKVGTTAGIAQAGGILNSLGPVQNDRLQKLLGAAGNLNLGNGVSGNDVLGDFNRAINVPFLARVRSGLSGGRESFGDAQRAIINQLDTLRDNAAKAEAAAEALRKRQEELAQLQYDVAKLQKDQLAVEAKNKAAGDKNLPELIKDSFDKFGNLNDKLNTTIDDLASNIGDLTKTLRGGISSTSVVTIAPLNVSVDVTGLSTKDIEKFVLKKVADAVRALAGDDPEAKSRVESTLNSNATFGAD